LQKTSSNNTTIYLIRHAEVHNPKRIIYVRLPGFGLSKLGFFQAQKLKCYFAFQNIEAFYSSPLLRSRQTAGIIAGNDKVSISKELTEINFSKWQGLTYEERTIKEIEEYVINPDKIDYLGESPQEAQVRMVDEIYRIIHHHKGKEIAIVSHADPIILAILYFREMNIKELNNTTNPNGSIYKIQFNDSNQCEKIEYIQVAPAKKDWP